MIDQGFRPAPKSKYIIAFFTFFHLKQWPNLGRALSWPFLVVVVISWNNNYFRAWWHRNSIERSKTVSLRSKCTVTTLTPKFHYLYIQEFVHGFWILPKEASGNGACKITVSQNSIGHWLRLKCQYRCSIVSFFSAPRASPHITFDFGWTPSAAFFQASSSSRTLEIYLHYFGLYWEKTCMWHHKNNNTQTQRESKIWEEFHALGAT